VFVVCACDVPIVAKRASPPSMVARNSSSRFIMLSMMTGNVHDPKSHERVQPTSAS
jgi:hypothetical protein